MADKSPITQEEIDAFRQIVPPYQHNPTLTGPTKYRRFTSTKFIGHPLPGMKFNRAGELLVTLSVPYEYRDAAYMLADSIEQPIIITIESLADHMDELYAIEEGNRNDDD